MWNVGGIETNETLYTPVQSRLRWASGLIAKVASSKELFLLLALLVSTGCGQLTLIPPASSGSSVSGGGSITVTSVALSNNVLTIQGSGLDTATGVQIKGVGTFTILSQTATQLQAVAASSVTLALNTLYSLVVSNAEASGGSTISFSVPGTTQGSILFAGSGGNVSSDNSQFFWDDTNHRLGIGTASPAANLHVLGAANSTVAILDSNTSTNGNTWALSLGAKNTASVLTGYASIQATIVSSTAGAESGQLDFFVQNAGAAKDAMTILNNGNVGIGTTTPRTLLDLESTPSVSATLKLGYSSWDTFYIVAGSPTTITATKGPNDTGTGDLIFDTTIGANADCGTGPCGGSTKASMVIKYQTGNVGIGTTSPGAPLDVETAGATVAKFVSGANSTTCTVAAGNLSCSSDERLKKDIQPLDGALDKLLKVEGVTFLWKKDTGKKRNIGFIAQALEKVFPELVTTDERGYKQVNYANFVAVLANAVKEVYSKHGQQIDALDQRLTSIENASVGRVPASQDRLQKLEQENAALKSYLCAKDPGAPFCR